MQIALKHGRDAFVRYTQNRSANWLEVGFGEGATPKALLGMNAHLRAYRMIGCECICLVFNMPFFFQLV